MQLRNKQSLDKIGWVAKTKKTKYTKAIIKYKSNIKKSFLRFSKLSRSYQPFSKLTKLMTIWIHKFKRYSNVLAKKNRLVSKQMQWENKGLIRSSNWTKEWSLYRENSRKLSLRLANYSSLKLKWRDKDTNWRREVQRLQTCIER